MTRDHAYKDASDEQLADTLEEILWSLRDRNKSDRQLHKEALNSLLTLSKDERAWELFMDTSYDAAEHLLVALMRARFSCYMQEIAGMFSNPKVEQEFIEYWRDGTNEERVDAAERMKKIARTFMAFAKAVAK